MNIALRDALVSAALRHMRDAEHLAGAGDHRSLDQARHLAGYGPECARKACFAERWADKAIGHRLDEIGDEVVEFVVGLDIRANRYHVADWMRTYATLRDWTTAWRYDATGTAEQGDVQRLLETARQAVDGLVYQLWLDGRLGETALELGGSRS